MTTKIILSSIILFGTIASSYGSGKSASANSSVSSIDKAARIEAIMKKTGGFVIRKSEGVISFINCQSKISDGEIQKRVDRIQFVLKYPCEIKQGNWKFGDKKPDGSKIAVFIVNDQNLPMSLVAVEAGWGVINTFSLANGTQFSKELTRVFCLTAGGANSPVKTSPMQTVLKSTDLDKLLTDGFTFDMASSINENLQAMGMFPMRKITYVKACHEGWAPTPTNEYQKAIWDKVHAAPKNPMKIEFDPKKGR